MRIVAFRFFLRSVFLLSVFFFRIASSQEREESISFEFYPLVLYEYGLSHISRSHFLDKKTLESPALESFEFRTGILQDIEGNVPSLFGIGEVGDDWGEWRISLGASERTRIHKDKIDLNRDSEIRLREAYWHHSIGEQHTLTVGKILLPWSGGLVFQPLDVLGRGRINNIGDNFGELQGLFGVKWSYSYDEGGFDLVLAEESFWEWDNQLFKGQNLGDRGKLTEYEESEIPYQYALRWQGNLGEIDTSLLIHGGSERGLGLGSSIFWGVSNNFSLKGEWLVRQGSSRPIDARLVGKMDKNKLVEQSPFDAWNTRDDLFFQGAIGMQWNPYWGENLQDIVFEYLYDQRGLSHQQWDDWLDMVEQHKNYRYPKLLLPQQMALLQGLQNQVDGNLDYDALTLLQGGGLVRQHYAFLQWTPSFTSWTPTVNLLCNLEDLSCQAGGTLLYSELGGNFQYRIEIEANLGDNKSQFGNVPSEYKISSGIWLYSG